MNFLLAIEKSDHSQAIIETKGFIETLLFGGKMLLIGMATVFAVLCLIWLCLSLFKIFFHDLKSKKTTAVKVDQTEQIEQIEQTSTDESEIIAVIAAAIAMAESENSGVKFKVVSFKRK